MILKIDKVKSRREVVSKLGNKFYRNYIKTVYRLKCDACGKKFSRDKGDAWHIAARNTEKHACSNNCSGVVANESRLEGYKYPISKRKNGYEYKNNQPYHRIVAEKMLGRNLKKEERVHHIDGDKSNNSEDNLYVCDTTKLHNALHGQLEKISFELIRMGIIVFDRNTGSYMISGEYQNDGQHSNQR